LRYWIAPGVFKKFTADLKLYCKEGTTEKASIRVLNDGKVIREIVLDAAHPCVELEITDPANEVSLVMESSSSCGVIALEECQFLR
jgi:hypothetical protein